MDSPNESPRRSAGWILLNMGLLLFSWVCILAVLWFWLVAAPLLWPTVGR